MNSSIARDVAHEAAKATPPVIVWSLTLNEWVAVASILYIALQAAFLLRKWLWLREDRRRKAEASS